MLHKKCLIKQKKYDYDIHGRDYFFIVRILHIIGRTGLFVFPMRKQEDDVDDLFEKKGNLPFAKSVLH
ncbi:hypothetical protein BPJM79_10837 [Bacillus pumilus]